jgi:hypothetical protein
MKTLAIPAVGWSEAECETFEADVAQIASDFYTDVQILYTTDHYYEIDIEEDDTAVEWLILNVAPEA